MRPLIEAVVGVSVALAGLLLALFGASQGYIPLAVGGGTLLLTGVLVWPGSRYRRAAQRVRAEPRT